MHGAFLLDYVTGLSPLKGTRESAPFRRSRTPSLAMVFIPRSRPLRVGRHRRIRARTMLRARPLPERKQVTKIHHRICLASCITAPDCTAAATPAATFAASATSAAAVAVAVTVVKQVCVDVGARTHALAVQATTLGAGLMSVGTVTVGNPCRLFAAEVASPAGIPPRNILVINTQAQTSKPQISAHEHPRENYPSINIRA